MFLLASYCTFLTFCRTSVREAVGVPDDSLCKNDPDCLSANVPLLKNVRTSLIDEDTPDSVKTKTSNDGKKLTLVVY